MCSWHTVIHINRNKFQNLDSRIVLQFSVPNPLKPCVMSRMKYEYIDTFLLWCIPFLTLRPSDAYKRRWPMAILVQITAPERRQVIIWTNVGLLSNGSPATNFSKFWLKYKHFHSRIFFSKNCLANGGHCVSASICFDTIILCTVTEYRLF